MRKTLGALALVSVVSLALGFSACGSKSERSLRQQFQANRATIDQLLDMQLQDKGVVRIAPTFTRLENDWSWPRSDLGFTQERWNSYQLLFKRAGVTDGLQKDGKFIWYFVSSSGLAIAGTSRGFVFTKEPPQPIVTKLENCPKVDGVCYVALEKDWYLFQWN